MKHFIVIYPYMSSSVRLFVAKIFCAIIAVPMSVIYTTTHNSSDTIEGPRLCLVACGNRDTVKVPTQ